MNVKQTKADGDEERDEMTDKQVQDEEMQTLKPEFVSEKKKSVIKSSVKKD